MPDSIDRFLEQPTQIAEAPSSPPAVPDATLDRLRQIESGGDVNAVSSAGALGPYQFMPATAEEYGIDPRDPVQAREGARRYLQDSLRTFDGDMEKALASYNAGRGGVQQAVEAGGDWRQNLPAETQGYLRKFGYGQPEAQTVESTQAATQPDAIDRFLEGEPADPIDRFLGPPPQTDQPEEPEDQPGALQRGAESGWEFLKAMSGGAAAAVGDLVGAEDVQEWGTDVFRRYQEDAREKWGETPTLTEVFQSEDKFDDFASWAGANIGQGAVTSVPALLSFLASPILGTAVVYGMGVGETYGAQLEESEDPNARIAAAAGVPYAVAERLFGAGSHVARQLMGRAGPRVSKSFVTRLATEVPSTAFGEMIAEGTQEATIIGAAGIEADKDIKDIYGTRELRQIMEGAAAGGIAGAPFGGVAAIPGPSTQPAAQPETPAEEAETAGGPNVPPTPTDETPPEETPPQPSVPPETAPQVGEVDPDTGIALADLPVEGDEPAAAAAAPAAEPTEQDPFTAPEGDAMAQFLERRPTGVPGRAQTPAGYRIRATRAPAFEREPATSPQQAAEPVAPARRTAPERGTPTAEPLFVQAPVPNEVQAANRQALSEAAQAAQTPLGAEGLPETVAPPQRTDTAQDRPSAMEAAQQEVTDFARGEAETAVRDIERDIEARTGNADAALREAARREAQPQRQRIRQPQRDQSLLEFLAASGVQDQTGELRAMDAQRWHRDKPFRRRLVRDDGMPPDAAREAAVEAGYLPEGADISDLYEAIDTELRGGAVDASGQRTVDRAVPTDRAELEAEADRLGVTYDQDTPLDELTDRVVRAETQRLEDAETLERLSDTLEDEADAITREVLATDTELADAAESANIPDIPFSGEQEAQAEVAAAPAEAGPEAGVAGEARPGGRAPERSRAGEREGVAAEETVEPDVAPTDVPRETTDQTDQGEQAVVPGAERISEREQAERGAEGRQRAQASQQPADEGLFDTGARGQQDLIDAARRTDDDETLSAFAADYTDGYRADAQRVVERVRALAQKVAPQADVSVVNELFANVAGQPRRVRGSFDGGRSLITVALNYADPAHTLRHEAIHSLKAMGLFTNSEWQILQRRAESDWRERYEVDQTYHHLNTEQRNEEAIAQAFAEHRGGRRFPPGLRRLFERIRTFLTRLGNTLRGLGYTSVDDIFQRVASGEVGRRQPQAEPAAETRYSLEETLSEDELAAVQQMRKKIGAEKPSLKKRFAEFVGDRLGSRFRQAAADDLHALNLREMQANQGKLYEDARSAYKLARLSRGISDTVMAAMFDGAVVWKEGTTAINPDVKAPMQIIEELGDRVADFEVYMAARRAQELLAQGKERLFADVDLQSVRDGMERANPDFVQHFDDMQTYNKALLDFVEASGLIDPETRGLFEEMHKNYVPFHRIMEGGDPKAGTAKMGFAGQHPNFWRIKGGESNIDRPMLSWERNIHRLIEASVKNVVMLRLEQINAEIGDMVMVPRGRQASAALVDNRQMLKDLENQGLEITNPEEIDASALRTLWSLGNVPKGENMVSWVRAGKVRFAEVQDPLLYRALTQLSRTLNRNPLLAPFRMSKRLLTAAVGLDPNFQVGNTARDTVQAWATSHVGFVPFIDSFRGMRHMLMRSTAMRKMFNAGAGMSSLFEADRPAMHDQIEERITKGNIVGKVLKTPKQLLGHLERLESTFEYSTRVAAFNRMRKDGKPLMEAAYMAREVSSDFAMKGDSVALRVLTDTVPFLNAGIQGLYRTYRGGGEPGTAITRHQKEALGPEGVKERNQNLLRTALKASIIASIYVFFYLQNRDDERYQALPEWQRDTYLILGWTDDVGLDKKGEGKPIKFPNPFEVGGLFGTLPQRATEFAIEGNTERFAERLGFIFTEMFRLDPIPQLVRPPLRIYSNWDEFRDSPVVPPHLQQRLLPEEQYTTRTSQTAVAIGRMLGKSPEQVEAVIEGYFAAMGTYALAAGDTVLSTLTEYPVQPGTRWYERPAIRRFIGSDIPHSTRYRNQFYEMKDQADRVWYSYQELIGRGEVNRARRLLREKRGLVAVRDSLSKIQDQLTKLYNAQQTVRQNNAMSAEQKRRRIDDLQKTINRLTRIAPRIKERVEALQD